jgi:hypothetical protein
MKSILLFHEPMEYFQLIRVRADFYIDLEFSSCGAVTEKYRSLEYPTFYPTPFYAKIRGHYYRLMPCTQLLREYL